MGQNNNNKAETSLPHLYVAFYRLSHNYFSPTELEESFKGEHDIFGYLEDASML